MATFPGPGNAITSAQFRLQGGWRGTAMVAGITLTLMVGMATVAAVAELSAHRPPAAALRDWPQGLLVLQVVFLFVVGPVRITAAVRGDMNSRMWESHRLMPMTPTGVVAGYLTGGPWAAVVLAAVTAGFGAALCVTTAVPVDNFVVANMVLALTAACLWAVTAHLAMVSRFGVVVLGVVSLFALSGAGGPAQLTPGLNVLTSPLLTRSAVVISGTSLDLPSAGVAYAGQALIAAICFRAATRLYRTPGAIGLSAPLGLALVAVWVGSTLAGLGWPEAFGPGRLSRYGPAPADQLVSSIVVTMLLAGLPLAAEAKAAAARRRSGEPAGRRRTAAVIGLVAAGLVCAVPFGAVQLMGQNLVFRQITYVTDPNGSVQALRIQRTPPLGPALLLTPAIAVAALIGVAFVFRLAYLRLERAWLVLAVWVFTTWVVPLMVDAALSADSQVPFGRVASVSPVGALTELWTRDDASPVAGVILQFVVAAVPVTLVAIATLARDRRTRVGTATPAVEPASA